MREMLTANPRGKTRLAKWYVPYTVSPRLHLQLWEMPLTYFQDEEKLKLKGEVRDPLP
jgi:hypothetical protein